MEILAVFIVVLGGVYFLVFRRKSVTNSAGTLGLNGGSVLAKPKKGVATARSPWRATSIVHRNDACDAVKAISGKRFLDTDRVTPVIPLPGCDASQCHCSYARHEDRRDSSEDRRAPNALQSDLYVHSGQTNRRARKRGRRKTDWT